MNAPAFPSRWHAAVDVAATAGLCLLALVPLASTFDDPRFWLAAGTGVILGSGVALLGARLRGGPLEVAVMTLVAYFGFGAAATRASSALLGVLPGLETLRDLGLAVVFGWKQLLTATVPVSGFDELFAMPFLVGLLGAVLAVGFALRGRHPAVALLPVAALLVFAISFGDYQTTLPELVGGGTAVLGLGWAAWRRHRSLAEGMVGLVAGGEEARRALVRRVGLGATALVVALGLGVGGGLVATRGWDRAILREEVIPPHQLHDYASPLMSFRKLAEDGKDTTLFTVSGLPAGGVLRVAALDLYDGIVYQVSGAGGAGSGVFARVGRNLRDDASGAPATLRVTIKDWRGVWLPDAGYLTGIEFSGPRAAQLRSALNYNAATGTALVTIGLAEGESYTLQTRLPAVPGDDELSKAKVAQIATPVPEMVPDAVQDRLDEAIQGAEAPLAQLVAIESYLHDEGFYREDLGVDDYRSRSGHTYERLAMMLDDEQMVGDDEQYSVVMALMAAQLGLPARVVMGFAPGDVNPSGETAVTGEDVKVWVEVPVEGHGWVAFHPTPPEDQKAPQQNRQQRQKPRVQVPQPPLPPQQPAELPPQPPDADEGEEILGQDFSWMWRLLAVGGISLGVLALLFGPGLTMLWIKARRRARRRSAARPPDRFSGGWAEIMDTATDTGLRLPPAATRREHATHLAGEYPALELTSLATRADIAVFGEGDPTPEEVDAYWADVESARRRMTAAAPMKRRLRQFFAPRSLLPPLGRKGRS